MASFLSRDKFGLGAVVKHCDILYYVLCHIILCKEKEKEKCFLTLEEVREII